MTPSSTTVAERLSDYEKNMSKDEFVLVEKQHDINNTTCEEFLTINESTESIKQSSTNPAALNAIVISDTNEEITTENTPSHSKQLELELAYSIIKQLKKQCRSTEKERDVLLDANKQWEEYYKNSKHCKSPKKCKQVSSEVEVLKQQLDIYKDDFAMERRDRVRAVMEVKRLRIENERLKNGYQ